jgi:hypothetical protein
MDARGNHRSITHNAGFVACPHPESDKALRATESSDAFGTAGRDAGVTKYPCRTARPIGGGNPDIGSSDVRAPMSGRAAARLS